MQTLKQYINNIFEAGAGGHMLYPFELPGVKDGKDLLNIYYKTIKSLKVNPASIKVDGSNMSIKLIDEGDKKVFAMDRCSSKEEDIIGVTIDRLEKRFGSGHGMIAPAKLILNLFNSNIYNIKKELEELGMWSDPTLILNLEYVSVDSNYGFSIKYDEDMIVLHNMRKIEREGRKTTTSEIPYPQKAIDSIVKKLSKEFKIFGNIPTTFEGDPTPDLKRLLNEYVSVNITKGDVRSIQLKDILVMENPIDFKKFKDANKKPKSVLNKQLMVDVVYNKKLLSDLVWLPEMDERIDDIITGIIYNYFTIKAGDIILKHINSEIGSGDTQEGIIIRDDKVSKDPFKIVGSFLLNSTINHM